MDLRKNRDKLIPGIVDWEMESKLYRQKKVKNLRFYQWFWFHPSSFSFLLVGSLVCFLLFIFGLMYWTVYIHRIYILLVVYAYVLYRIWKMISGAMAMRKAFKSQTFYDICLKKPEDEKDVK